MAQDMHEWLAGFAAEIGVAAHASERAAAPLTCWLAARAGLEPAAALAVGKRLAGQGQSGNG